MKKRTAPPVTQMTEEVSEAVDALLEVFGEIQFLQAEVLDEAITDAAERIARSKRDLVEMIKAAKNIVDRRAEVIAGGAELPKRRVHIFFCRGCGQHMIVTSGPKGHEGKSTLKGGCYVCKEPNKHGIRSGSTLFHAVWMGEVT